MNLYPSDCGIHIFQDNIDGAVLFVLGFNLFQCRTIKIADDIYDTIFAWIDVDWLSQVNVA